MEMVVSRWWYRHIYTWLFNMCGKYVCFWIDGWSSHAPRRSKYKYFIWTRVTLQQFVWNVFVSIHNNTSFFVLKFSCPSLYWEECTFVIHRRATCPWLEQTYPSKKIYSAVYSCMTRMHLSSITHKWSDLKHPSYLQTALVFYIQDYDPKGTGVLRPDDIPVALGPAICVFARRWTVAGK